MQPLARPYLVIIFLVIIVVTAAILAVVRRLPLLLLLVLLPLQSRDALLSLWHLLTCPYRSRCCWPRWRRNGGGVWLMPYCKISLALLSDLSSLRSGWGLRTPNESLSSIRVARTILNIMLIVRSFYWRWRYGKVKPVLAPL